MRKTDGRADTHLYRDERTDLKIRQPMNHFIDRPTESRTNRENNETKDNAIENENAIENKSGYVHGHTTLLEG